jgi:hypothetical protein
LLAKKSLVAKKAAAKKAVAKKRRGPAPTGKGAQIGERWHPSELAAIDGWIADSNDPAITRAHAVRRLVALGLSVRPARAAGGGQRDRAASMANAQMDRMADSSATADDHAYRKRRLLKGPSMVRDSRKDHRKSK